MKTVRSVPIFHRHAVLNRPVTHWLFYVDRDNHKLVKSFLFDDEKDPYQMNNLPLEENKEIVDELCAEMGKVLKEIDDPWYRERILSDMIPYDK